MPDSLVSIGLPVRNGAATISAVIDSVLAQDHDRIELVISDNASTDGTEGICRALAAADPRVRYHRQSENIGLLNNFVATIGLAGGEYFRWIGDDDRLQPTYVSRCLGEFEKDPRLVLVTTAIEYVAPDGRRESAEYHGTALGSDDAVDRFVEMLRLLNESNLLSDPLYGMGRRKVVAAIPRRNMLREDEIFATKLALAGPWGHVNDVLASRNWSPTPIGSLARRLGVPSWQSHFSNTLQLREILRWLRDADLTREQRLRARAAVYGMYRRKQWRTVRHRSRKLLRMGR
jgi:glycosyltransferase involved in cell wall biosynthesis